MLIIIDRKIPEAAKKHLQTLGELLEISTDGITYDAISGHPDIFFCQSSTHLITAPNLPGDYQEFLLIKGIGFISGRNSITPAYPGTACYNAVWSEDVFIHNLKLTDPVILEQAGGCEKIHVSQGYCRCNLIALRNRSFITSDEGIHKVLAGKGFRVLYTDPAGIQLPGLPNGFIGGTCGITGNRVHFLGSLDHFKQGKDMGEFLRGLGYDIIELYPGPLFDGGGILFVNR
jgi:hypothetical protein